jgi:hypothetical protein
MREIEFRGKRKDTGEWVYGYYVVTDKHYIFTGKTGLSPAAPGHVLMYRDFERYEVIPETVEGTRAHHYTADFRYIENGVCVIEDVKGMKTKDYILRRDIFIRDYVRADTIFREYTKGVIKEFTA